MKLSIKRRECEEWQTGLTRSDIEEQFSSGQITGEWLVCPLGEVDRSIEVSRFLAEPTAFARESIKAPRGTDNGAATAPTVTRRADLDALRAIAMLLGIVLHLELAYVTIPLWPVHDDQTHLAFDIFYAGLHGFRMPLFFLISGYFTAMLWRRRGLRSLIKHRIKRILVPLVVLIVPIQAVSIVVLILVEPGLATKDDDDAVCLAAKQNDLPTLRRLYEEGGNPNSQDSVHEMYALNWAVVNGSLEAAEFLVEKGALIEVESRDYKTTPVGHAVRFGHPELIALLLENGADVNAVNPQTQTPLDIASEGHERVSAMAATLDVTIDFENLQENRSAAAALLAENDGVSASNLIGADAPWLSTITVAYRQFTAWHWFQYPRILGHLWFLWTLCILLIPFALWALVARRIDWQGPPEWLLRSPFMLLWAVPLTMIPQWFTGLRNPTFGADPSFSLTPAPHVLALYAVFFAVGALYFDCDGAERRIGRYWWISLPLALFVVLPIGLVAIHLPKHEWLVHFVPQDMIRPLGTFAQSFYPWLMIFGMIGLFRRLLTHENKVVRFVSDSSYWLYLAHVPLVFCLQAFLKPLDIPPLAKLMISFLIVTSLLLVSYRYVVRYTWLGTMLNGKRERPVKAIA